MMKTDWFRRRASHDSAPGCPHCEKPIRMGADIVVIIDHKTGAAIAYCAGCVVINVRSNDELRGC